MSTGETQADLRIVTFLTDFGQRDHYVGVMKGVLLRRAPGARIVDLTHEVEPQAVAQGAFLLACSLPYFPPGTVHVCVVDPGVGTHRRRLAMAANGHFFVGPDNGLLSPALADATRGGRPAGADYAAAPVHLPPEVEAFAIEEESLFEGRPSATFEGRDVFTPVAAFLASGGRLADLGRRVESILALPAFRAPFAGDELDGTVLHIDRFGNLITDVRAGDLPRTPTIVVCGRLLSLSRTYADASGLTAVIGSSGFLEVALPNGSAERTLGAGRGTRVAVLP